MSRSNLGRTISALSATRGSVARPCGSPSRSTASRTTITASSAAGRTISILSGTRGSGAGPRDSPSRSTASRTSTAASSSSFQPRPKQLLPQLPKVYKLCGITDDDDPSTVLRKFDARIAHERECKKNAEIAAAKRAAAQSEEAQLVRNVAALRFAAETEGVESVAAESYTVESVTAESAPAESASESYSEPGSECGTSTLEFDEMLRRGADIDEALRAIGVVLPDTVAVESVREESVKEESREDKLMATLKRAAGIKDDDSASVAFAKCDRAVKYELNRRRLVSEEQTRLEAERKRQEENVAFIRRMEEAEAKRQAEIRFQEERGPNAFVVDRWLNDAETANSIKTSHSKDTNMRLTIEHQMSEQGSMVEATVSRTPQEFVAPAECYQVAAADLEPPEYPTETSESSTFVTEYDSRCFLPMVEGKKIESLGSQSGYGTLPNTRASLAKASTMDTSKDTRYSQQRVTEENMSESLRPPQAPLRAAPVNRRDRKIDAMIFPSTTEANAPVCRLQPPAAALPTGNVAYRTPVRPYNPSVGHRFRDMRGLALPTVAEAPVCRAQPPKVASPIGDAADKSAVRPYNPSIGRRFRDIPKLARLTVADTPVCRLQPPAAALPTGHAAYRTPVRPYNPSVGHRFRDMRGLVRPTVADAPVCRPEQPRLASPVGDAAGNHAQLAELAATNAALVALHASRCEYSRVPGTLADAIVYRPKPPTAASSTESVVDNLAKLAALNAARERRLAARRSEGLQADKRVVKAGEVAEEVVEEVSAPESTVQKVKRWACEGWEWLKRKVWA